MADKPNESTKNEPEMWYKIAPDIDAEEVVESSSHSEDELDLSHGRNPSKLIHNFNPLIHTQTRAHQKPQENMPLTSPPSHAPKPPLPPN